jgi:molybdopterin-binding protein
VARAEVVRRSGAPGRPRTGPTTAARTRFPRTELSVEVDGVMAVVEIEAGPHRITSVITRDAVDELGLVAGMPATATVKSTSVMVERGAAA